MKPPRTSSRAGSSGLLGISWVRDGLRRRYLRREISREVDGTTNLGEKWEADGSKSSVVGDLVSTTDRDQVWHGDVGKVLVGNECEGTLTVVTSDSGQLWCVERLDKGTVESEGSVDIGQRSKADAGNVSEGHVGSPGKVVKGDIESSSVINNVEGLANVGKLGRKGSQSVVVVNVENVDSGQINTLEGAEEGVCDQNAVGLADGSTELKLAQTTKGSPRDGLDLGEVGEDEVGKLDQLVELKGGTNLLEGGATNLVELGSIAGNQTTDNGLWSIEADDSDSILADQNGTGEGLASGIWSHISLAVDGGGCGGADGVALS